MGYRMQIVERAFARVSIAAKLAVLSGFFVVVIGTVGAIGYSQIGAVEDRVLALSEKNLPLTEKVQTTKTHTLEAAIAFMHAAQTGERMAADMEGEAGKAEERFETWRGRFSELMDTAQQQLKTVDERMAALKRDATRGEQQAFWGKTLDEVHDIEKQTKTFREHASEVLAALDGGGASDIHARVLEAEGESEKIAKEIDEVAAQLTEHAQEVAHQADMLGQQAMRLLLGVGGGAVVLGLVVAALMTRVIAGPIRRAAAALTALREGDTSQTLPAVGRDETAKLAEAYETLRERTQEGERLRRENEETQRRAEEERKQAMTQLADEFEREVGAVIQSVASASTELGEVATSLGSSAEEAGQQATSVSSSAEQASANVNTVASSTQELTNSIHEISQRVDEAAQKAKGAVETANTANQKITSLDEAAEQIGEVVQQIQDIAEKTNLLALNATIEEARAGEAGKGFAVVADEVKSLASQTHKATEDISQRIQRVQSETKEAVSAINDVGQIIHQIDEAAGNVASAVEEQDSATRDISRNAEEASMGTTNVAEGITNVSDAAKQVGASATQVQTSVGDLSQQAENLRKQADSFVERVRAA